MGTWENSRKQNQLLNTTRTCCRDPNPSVRLRCPVSSPVPHGCDPRLPPRGHSKLCRRGMDYVSQIRLVRAYLDSSGRACIGWVALALETKSNRSNRITKLCTTSASRTMPLHPTPGDYSQQENSDQTTAGTAFKLIFLPQIYAGLDTRNRCRILQ